MVAASAAIIIPRQNDKKPPTADLWVGGDVNLGTNTNPVLESISEILKGSVGIVNLEGPVTTTRPARRPRLKVVNSPAAVQQLLGAGVRVVGIANNHSLDEGPSGFKQTIEAARNAGLLPAGGPAGAAVLNIDGVRIVISAFDLTRGVPSDLAKNLEAARKEGDVLLASFHITGPGSYLPRPELRKAVMIALKANATIIVAQGTHVIGPLERRGRAIIAWGLGNLAFACDCTKESEGLLLRLHVRAEGVTQASVIPIQAGLQGESAKLAPDASGIFDLLAAIGSTRMERHGFEADF